MNPFIFLKHLKRCILFSALLAYLGTSSIFAQEAASPKTRQYEVVNLRLSDAIELALENNILARIARERVSESDGIRLQTLSDLLPHISGVAYQQRVWHENFAAMGVPSFGVIGPFNDFDARLVLTQKLFDMSAISRSHEGTVGSQIARLEDDFARQKVIVAVILSYLEALRGYNNLQAVMADYGLAQRLFLQTRHQHEAGVATGVDVARAQTRAAQEKLRLSQGKLLYRESILELLRVTGLGLGARIRLCDSFGFFDEPVTSVNEVIDLAGKNRMEIKISKKNVSLQKYKLNEANFQYAPKVELAADYGWNDSRINSAPPSTGQGIIKASVPIFEGGLIQGQIRQAKSLQEQAQLTLEDVQRQVEEDVRLAVDRMKTGKEKVLFAEEVVTLAQKELAMARDRFTAGLGDNIEVLSAQTTLASAREDHVAALTEYHVARANLYSAVGQVEEFHLKGRVEKEKR